MHLVLITYKQEHQIQQFQDQLKQDYMDKKWLKI